MGSTTIAPGASSTITATFQMHAGMGGQHQFDITVLSNDAVQPEQTVVIKAKYP